jgi:hypothetical protein
MWDGNEKQRDFLLRGSLTEIAQWSICVQFWFELPSIEFKFNTNITWLSCYVPQRQNSEIFVVFLVSVTG